MLGSLPVENTVGKHNSVVVLGHEKKAQVKFDRVDKDLRSI